MKALRPVSLVLARMLIENVNSLKIAIHYIDEHTKYSGRTAWTLDYRTFLLGLASTAIWSFGGQLVSQSLDRGPTGPTILWSCIGAGGMWGAWAGTLVSPFGLGHVNVVFCSILAATIVAVGSGASIIGLVLVGGALFGAAYVMLTGIYLVWGVRALPDQPATGLKIGFLTIAIGQTAGVPLFGLLMGGVGVQTAIVTFGTLALLAGMIRTGFASARCLSATPSISQ